jgi:hypothetical protein
MGWQDDPVVEGAAPTDQAKATRAPRSSLQGGLTAARAAFPPQAIEAARGAFDFAKPSILPTAGSIALPAAATALAGPANAPFIPLEAGAGGIIGTGLNKLLGISEPTGLDYALSGGLPVAGQVAGNVARAIKPFVPLSKAAETMQPLAHTEALSKVASLSKGQDVKQLFSDATKAGVTVPLSSTRTMLQQIQMEVANATPAGRKAWQSILKETGVDTLTKPPFNASPARLQAVLADVGKLQSQAAREGGLKADKLGKLFSSLSDDLEQVPALAAARSAFKRESVLKEINDEIANAFRLNAGQTVEKFSPNKVVNALQDKDGRLGKFFSQAFTKAEQTDTIEFFKFLNTIPGLSPPRNAGQGSKEVLRAGLLGAGGGTAIAGLTGISPAILGPLGMAGAVAGGPVLDIVSTMRQAWKLPGGKELITSLFNNRTGSFAPHALGALGAFIAGKKQAPPSQPSNEIRPPTELPRAFVNQP